MNTGSQKLIGFETFTKYGVKTDKCEFIFFHVEPTNISVLSADNIDAKVHHLMMLLSNETVRCTLLFRQIRSCLFLLFRFWCRQFLIHGVK